MTWLLRILAGKFGGVLAAGVAAAFLVLAGALVVAKLDAAAANVRAANAQSAADGHKAEKLALQVRVSEQNAAVEALGRDCRERVDKAHSAALQQLLKQPPPVAGHGPAALNAWLARLAGGA